MGYVDIMIFGLIVNVWMAVFNFLYAYFHIIPRNPIQDRLRIKSLFIKGDFIRFCIPFSGILFSYILIWEFKKYQKQYPGSDSLDFYQYYFKEFL